MDLWVWITAGCLLLVVFGIWRTMDTGNSVLKDIHGYGQTMKKTATLDDVIRNGAILREAMQQDGYAYVSGRLIEASKPLEAEYTGWVMYGRSSDNHIRRFNLNNGVWMEHTHIPISMDEAYFQNP